MDKLSPFNRDILEYELSEFTGGSKFRNGDTLIGKIYEQFLKIGKHGGYTVRTKRCVAMVE